MNERGPGGSEERSSSMLVGLAVLAAVAGLTFTLQGVGVPIGRSFMIGDLRWTVIGICLVGFAAAVVWRRLNRR